MRDLHKGTANMTGRRPSATSPGAGLRPSRHSRLQRPATQAARLGAGPALGLEQTRPRSPSRPGKAPPGGAQTLHLRATRPIEQSRCPKPAAGPTGFPCGGARPWGGAPAAPPTGRRTRRDLLSPTRLQTCRGAALLPRGFQGGGASQAHACFFFHVRSFGPHLSIYVPSFSHHYGDWFGDMGGRPQ